MKRLLTVRAGYLYVFLGSALISGVILLIVYRSFLLVYARYSSDSNAFVVRFSHWLINHIGKTPTVILIFLAVFVAIFMLRSQKMADDVKSLLKAAGELAEQGSFEKLTISSIGELREMGACLERINKAATRTNDRPLSSRREAEAPKVAPGNEEVMALILRLKSLIRLLDDAVKAGDNQQGGGQSKMEAIKREALGMERFLENLIASP